MEHEEIAKRIGIKRTMWYYVRNNERNLKYKRAKAAAQLFRTKADVWQDSTKGEERVAAIEKFFAKKTK